MGTYVSLKVKVDIKLNQTNIKRTTILKSNGSRYDEAKNNSESNEL